MDKAKVTLSANAGVMLEYKDVKILVDILHNDVNVPVFSSVPEDVCRLILKKDGPFSGADYLIVSHDHPDHFSRQLVNEYVQINRSTVVIAPIKVTNRQLIFSGVSGRFSSKRATVTYFRVPHEKQQVYADAKHYAFVISIENRNFVFFNDSCTHSEYMEQILGDITQDAVFINFPWLTLKHARLLLQENIHTKNLIVYHLPIPKLDMYGYNKIEEKSVAALDLPDTAVFTLNEPLQTTELLFPGEED